MPENQTQPNNSGMTPSREARPDGAADGASPGGESRSFESRPSDTEAAHAPEEGSSVREPTQGEIGGDMGRDASKGQQGLDPNAPGGEMEHQDPRHMDDLEKVQGNDRGAMEAEGGAGSTYDPSDVEATRARMQGGGVGQKDLEAQRDATGADSTEHFGQMKSEDRGEGRTDVEGGGLRGSGVEQT